MRPVNLMIDPLIIQVLTKLPEINFCHPISGWPTAGGLTGKAHRPRVLATGRDFSGKREQIVPGCGNLVALCLEVRRAIPDRALIGSFGDQRVETSPIRSQI